MSEQIENNKRIFEDNRQLKLSLESVEKVKADLFEKYKLTSEDKSKK